VLKKGYMIIALAIVSVLLGSLFLNNSTQARSGVKITANIKIVVEMTAYDTLLTFNGLSIKDVYPYTVTNGTWYMFFPYVYLSNIHVRKEAYDDSYFRVEMSLKVFVSNETVSMRLFCYTAPGYRSIDRSMNSVHQSDIMNNCFH